MPWHDTNRCCNALAKKLQADLQHFQNPSSSKAVSQLMRLLCKMVCTRPIPKGYFKITPPWGTYPKWPTWIHISSHFKSGYPALQTCTAQSNMVSCRATIATNFVLAEIPSISRNSSRDRRPSTHGRNSFLVTSACTRPISKCPPPSPGHRQGTIAYVGIIDATSRATTDGPNNKLARTHSLFFMDVANIPVSLEIDSSLWLANSPCEAAQATRDLAFASSGQISAT